MYVSSTCVMFVHPSIQNHPYEAQHRIKMLRVLLKLLDFLEYTLWRASRANNGEAELRRLRRRNNGETPMLQRLRRLQTLVGITALQCSPPPRHPPRLQHPPLLPPSATTPLPQPPLHPAYPPRSYSLVPSAFPLCHSIVTLSLHLDSISLLPLRTPPS